MEVGIKTDLLPSAPALSEVLGNYNGSTAVMGFTPFVNTVVAAGLVGAAPRQVKLWSELLPIIGSGQAAPSIVFGPDATNYGGAGVGKHIDPVSGLAVDNAGNYSWNVTPAGWKWISAVVDATTAQATAVAADAKAVAAQAEINAARDGTANLLAMGVRDRAAIVAAQLVADNAMLAAGGTFVTRTEDVDTATSIGASGVPVILPLKTSRASTGMAQNSDGSWVTFAANTPRRTGLGLVVENAATNLIPNPRATGAAASGNVLPTGWSKQEALGTTLNVSDPLIRDGAHGVDITLAGTATNATVANRKTFLFFTPVNAISSLVNDWRTVSAFVAVLGANLTGVASVKLYFGERGGAAGATSLSAQESTALPIIIGERVGKQRFGMSKQVLSAGNTFIQPGIVIEFLQNVTLSGLSFFVGLPNSVNAPVLTSPINALDGIRAQDHATAPSAYAPFGSFRVKGRTPLGKPLTGNQVLASRHNGTALEGWHVQRNAAGNLLIVGRTGGVDTVTLNFGVYPDNTDYDVEVIYNFARVTAVLNGRSVKQATGAYPSAFTTLEAGGSSANEACDGIIYSLLTDEDDTETGMPEWLNKNARVAINFEKGWFKNVAPLELPVVRATGHNEYDVNGVLKAFLSNTLAYPCYRPDTKEPLGAAFWTSSGNFALQALTPATQSPSLGAGSWCVWGLGSGTITVSGADTGNGVFSCTPAGQGFFGAGAGLVFTNTSTHAVTLTVAGSVTAMYLEINGSTALNQQSFPSPPINTTTAALSRQVDRAVLDTTLFPGLFNLDRGTWACRFYLHRQMTTGGTFLTFTDGTVTNRVSANFKWYPAGQSGVTYTVGASQLATDPPANLQVGWNTFAFSYDLANGYSAVSQNGSTVVSATIATRPATGSLNKILFGCDFISGIYSSFLNGYIPKVHYEQLVVSNAQLERYSSNLDW